MTTQLVATLSVPGATGQETFSVSGSNMFSVSGNQLLAPSDLPVGQYSISIQAIGPGLTITQSAVLSYSGSGGLLATITLDNIPIGVAFVALSTDMSGSLTWSFTSNPGNLFSFNGSQIQVAGLLTVTDYTIGVQVTNGSATQTATLTVDCISVANSWIPGVRPFLPTSPCNTLLSNSATLTPVAWPASTGFNYFTGIKYYFDQPLSTETTVVSWLAPESWGNPTQILNVVMTPGFNGVELLLNNGDNDNEAISFAGTTCLSIYQFNRLTNMTANSGAYASTDIIDGTGFGTLTPTVIGAGVVATGSSLMMGCILKEEFALYGDFNHWIGFSMIDILTQPGFQPPAISGDGQTPGGLFQEGQLLAIPKATAQPGGLSIYGQAMFRAMQNYGAWCFDKGGSVTPYCARSFNNPSASWSDADIGLLIADVNILFPLLYAVS